MLLKKLDGVAQVGEPLDGVLVNLSNITEVGHNLGKKLLITLGSEVLGQNFDTLRDLLDEALNVVKLLHSVIIKEACEFFNPIINSGLKLLDQRARVNSKPANIGGGLDRVDTCLVFVESGDLSVEDFKSRLLRYNAFEDLDRHGIEIFDFKLNLLLFEIVLILDLVKEDIPDVATLIEESLESSLKVLLPEEGDIGVLLEEILGVLLDLV